MNIKPLGKRVLVKLTAMEEKTEGGIYLGSNQKAHHFEGEVIAIGDDVTLLKIGTNVILSKAIGNPLELDRTQHLLLEEDEVLGIIEE